MSVSQAQTATENASRHSGGRWASIAVVLIASANVAVLFSIFASQTLLGLGLAALVASRLRPRAPAVLLPLALIAAWTVLSLLASPAPALGLPQIKKLYILLAPVAAYTVLSPALSRRVVRLLFIAAAVAGVLAIFEFGLHFASLHTASDFYAAYSRFRITGFMSHWQTFSGQQMLVLVLLAAFLLVSQQRPWWTWTAAAIISASLLLGFTRGAWLGALAGVSVVLWRTRRRWLLVIPLALVAVYLLAPGLVQQRIRSMTDLRADSSNRSRVLMLQTGLRMVAAHPLFGVGPEGVRHYFDQYAPPLDGPRPDAWYGHLHSNYLQLAAERGVPCLLLFLWFLVALFRDQWRAFTRQTGEERWITLGMTGAVAAFAVAGIFEYSFGDSEVAMLFLFLVAHGCIAVPKDSIGRASGASRSIPPA